jgi:hypothetical protein
MKINDEHKRRWIEVHRRMADLAIAMGQLGPDKEQEFELFAGEMDKANARVEDLLRQMMSEEDYQEHQRELKAKLAKGRKDADDHLRALIGDEYFQMVMRGEAKN